MKLLKIARTVSSIALGMALLVPIDSAPLQALVGEVIVGERTSADVAVSEPFPNEETAQSPGPPQDYSQMPIPMNLGAPRGAHASGLPEIAAPEPGGTRTSSTSTPAPPVGSSFLAMGDNNTVIPPDTHGSVGPNHLLVTLNSDVRIQSRTGSNLSTVSLSSFWSSTGASGPFDPKSLFDPYGGRFMFTAMSNRRSGGSSVLIGVTATDNPTGTWHKYRFDADGSNVSWADYPSMGFTKDWIIVQVNMFAVSNDAFNGSKVFVFDKASLYAGGSGAVTAFTLSGFGGTQVPAITYSTTLTTGYLLQDWDGSSLGSGFLRIYTITGSVGSETLTVGSFVSTPNTWASFPPGDGDFAPQLGTSAKIQLNDSRMQNVVYRNGSLWAVHHVFLPASSPNRSAVQWWEINPPAASIIQRARIDDSTAAKFYAFPTIAVNSDDDVLIGYSRFGADQYASANWSFRSANDPLNTLQGDTILKAGEAKYVKTYSGTRNRWGDYSNTVVDPANDGDFWTIQEYAWTPFGGNDRWSTWWGRIDAFPAAPRLVASPTSLSFGNQGQGTTSASQSITVSNLGDANLILGTVTKEGSHPGDFTVTTDACSGGTVVPAGTCTISASFSPTATGSRSASLRIPSNDAYSPHTIPLSGNGIVNGPGISLSATTLNYGNVKLGTTSATKGVVVTSIGSSSLNIGTVSLGGTNASEFSITSNTCNGASLSYGQTCVVGANLSPAVRGTRTASITIPNNAPSAPHVVGLTGIGYVDLTPPVSTFTNVDNSAVIRSGGGEVVGRTTDDASGVDIAAITFTPVTGGTPITVYPSLSCAAQRKLCLWEFTPPSTIFGLVFVNAHATDKEGNLESPGPTITLLII